MKSNLVFAEGRAEAVKAADSPAFAAENDDSRKRRFWTTVEVATLKRHCEARRSWSELQAALPGRSDVAIYQKAQELGLECGSIRMRPAANEELDAALRTHLDGASGGEIKQLADRFQVPAWYVSRRAGQLGLTSTRLKEPDWTRPELDIVQRYGEDGGAAVHRQLRLRGFSRTVGSVSMAIKRLQVERLSSPSMSARAVAELMGVDGKTVVRWLEHCGLNAQRVEGGWGIRSKELRRWLLDNPDRFDIRKVKQTWFMSLMKGD